jgi:DNA repair protein RadA/Sms
MARNAEKFVCQSCGAVSAKWSGRCDACGEWNSIAEETPTASAHYGLTKGKARKIALVPMAGTAAEVPRLVTGLSEFDRVTGGGLVPGSAVLIGGDPGIGKSTLLLQVMAAVGSKAHAVYISGEEAIDQVRLRARRLGLDDAKVQLAAETSVRDILATLENGPPPGVVVIDSIQTMWLDSLESAPGTVGQVRAAAHELVRFAKTRGSTVLLVGHVTKDGQIAGPRVVEHMVDAVLYFEGERGHQFRILRGVKNRFGATDEIGVFEMTDRGLSEVTNPSALFLTTREGAVSGAAVFAGIEGTRPILVEIQALVAQPAVGTPRRAVVGWDSSRLAMVLAVLETRCGVVFGGRDIYLNIAGGLKISEPAADLAVAAALVSSLTDEPIAPDTVFFGEVGLSGEVRAVGQTDARLKEAQKLGFKRAIVPALGNMRGSSGLAITELRRLDDLVEPLAQGKLR